MPRPEYEIKDKRLEKLVGKIENIACTPYQDMDTFNVAELIEDYINKYYNKVTKEQAKELLNDYTHFHLRNTKINNQQYFEIRETAKEYIKGIIEPTKK